MKRYVFDIHNEDEVRPREDENGEFVYYDDASDEIERLREQAASEYERGWDDAHTAAWRPRRRDEEVQQ